MVRKEKDIIGFVAKMVWGISEIMAGRGETSISVRPWANLLGKSCERGGSGSLL